MENTKTLSKKNIFGYNSLSLAVIDGDIKRINRLIHHFNVSPAILDNNKNSLIMLSICKSKSSDEQVEDVVKYLHKVSNGSMINKKNIAGNTPLIMAITMGMVKLAHILIESGSDVTLSNVCGETPLFHAVRYGLIEMIQPIINNNKATLFQKTTKGTTILMEAAGCGNIQVVEMILKHYTDVRKVAEEYDVNGLSFIFYALNQSCVKLIIHLIEKYPFLIRCMTKSGEGMVSFATRTNNKNLVFFLKNKLKHTNK